MVGYKHSEWMRLTDAVRIFFIKKNTAIDCFAFAFLLPVGGAGKVSSSLQAYIYSIRVVRVFFVGYIEHMSSVFTIFLPFICNHLAKI